MLATQETKAKNSQAVATTTNHEQNITQIVYQTSKSRHTKLERMSRAKRRENTETDTNHHKKQTHIFFIQFSHVKRHKTSRK